MVSNPLAILRQAYYGIETLPLAHASFLGTRERFPSSCDLGVRTAGADHERERQIGLCSQITFASAELQVFVLKNKGNGVLHLRHSDSYTGR